jgi:AcrR family transcriptional regulator
MTLGVFHYCFTSREELLQEVGTRLTDRNVEAAREAFSAQDDLGASIAKVLQHFWEGVELYPGRELVGYELSQYALRQEGSEGLAQRQYAHYLEVHAELLEEAAEAAGIEWTVPVPVLARYLNSVLEGLTLCWLADRDSDSSREVLQLTGEHLRGLTRKREPVTGR